MFCAKCGKQIPEDGKFCVSCGTPVVSGDNGIKQPVPAIKESVLNTPTTSSTANRKAAPVLVIVLLVLAVLGIGVWLLSGNSSPASNLSLSVEEAGKSFEFTKDSDGVTITGYKGEQLDVVIPRVIGGSFVTGVGNHAFDGCGVITSVTFPDTITWLGEGAFQSCTSLKKLNLPKSLKTIRSYAFSSCESLVSVTIPESVNEIGSIPDNEAGEEVTSKTKTGCISTLFFMPVFLPSLFCTAARSTLPPLSPRLP